MHSLHGVWAPRGGRGRGPWVSRAPPVQEGVTLLEKKRLHPYSLAQ